MRNFFKKNKGFTLVESLVAISILSLSILSTFTVVQSSLKSSSISKDQIIAFYLAQDVMEWIKNKRDNNALDAVNGGSNTWLTGISALETDACWYGGGLTAQKTCEIDTTTNTITTCPGAVCNFLRNDPVTNKYGYSGGWTVSQYKRSVQLTKIIEVPPTSDEVKVTITITWANRGVPQTFQISQTLFNRQ
jgi:prepilin-type N-terminal cleavage/methylation domain-containing protein